MPLVDIHVDLPAYSTSFSVQVDASASVLELKQAIQTACTGQPRPDGQRLIWRGRILENNERIDGLWKAERRVVHLAVHPSAWSSAPPIPQSASMTPASVIPASPQSTPSPTMDFEHLVRPKPQHLPFIMYKHQQALSFLSPSVTFPVLSEDPHAARAACIAFLEKQGLSWPAILDGQYPPVTPGGLRYYYVSLHGQPYLQLLNKGEHPTPAQLHALDVLSVTFSILSIPVTPTPTTRTTVHSQQVPVPPHVNHLLQQLGMPPLRAANGAPNPAVPEVREIPIRLIVGPLVMVLFRTSLLLYFFAPARTPLFGIAIFAWMVYEIWQPIQRALRNNAANQPRQDGQPGAAPADAPARNPAPGVGGNEQQAPLVPNSPVALQSAAVMERLAHINIANEERILNGAPGEEPGWGYKLRTFFSLLATTLHPAVWDRRRAALRRREGTIRTEANARNAPEATGDGDEGEQRRAELRNQLQARFERQPQWVQRYINRVVAEDWYEDSD